MPAPSTRTAPISGLNTRIQPKVQGDVAAWFGSVPAVPAACKGNALLTDDGCKTNGYDNFSRIKFWKTPVAKCSTQATCVPYYRWVDGLYRHPWRTLTPGLARRRDRRR